MQNKGLRRLRWPLAGALALGMSLVSFSAWGAGSLAVSTWGFNLDLINKNITQPFEKATGVRISYELGNNSDRFTKLMVRKGNPNVDVVHLTDDFAARAVKEGLLQPIDVSRLSNYDQIYDWAKDPVGGHYAVGYTVQDYGIVYRTDKIKTPITSWKDLWRDDLAGHISLPDITTTQGPATVVMASRAWGGSEKDVDVGFARLKALRDNVVTFYNRSSQLVTLFQQGEVWAAPVLRIAWGQLLETGLPLRWVAPKEGSVGFVNVLGIVKGTRNLDAAYRYVDFLLSEQVQKAEALDLVDSPVNRKVELPPDKAKLLTYGQDNIEKLIFLDPNYLLQAREQWVDRWNREIAF
ncbi:ABC transporter substrate-binding protein [Carboxydochorda subterranea]|uniref:ABC transporter substrate-binding protein n=1 Tax=Carboxydichorda subterranea TaxID=3109565 RepID=A0ABZ1BY04_9FIRM|nr:ABC transporter substrate-binding protein [Limnochorda sp. L945t]WRP17571.1 ABC transporter substrate-binding protein [Limnochorda sp. L945t]